MTLPLQLRTVALPRILVLVDGLAHEGDEGESLVEEFVVEDGGVLVDVYHVDGHGRHLADHYAAQGVGEGDVAI